MGAPPTETPSSRIAAFSMVHRIIPRIKAHRCPKYMKIPRLDQRMPEATIVSGARCMTLPRNTVATTLKTQRRKLTPLADCHTLSVRYCDACLSTSAGSVLHHKRKDRTDLFDFLEFALLESVIVFRALV
jgi:hypothetical protein